jgi:hypothetical protein
MAGGQQITSGQGTVTAGKGGTVSGEEATAAAGDTASARLHPLRSRKVGGGSATHAISGQAITSAFGLFTPVPERATTGQVAALFGGFLGRERNMPLTGQSSTVSSGLMTTSGGGVVAAGTLVHDGPATPEQISLWMPVTGVVAQTATASCRYRVQGAGSWTVGHPLYRVRPTFSTSPAVGGAVEDGFAWVIIGLNPGTTYEVEVTLTEGAVNNVKTLTHTTRALPATAGAANKTTSTVSDLRTKLTTLNPGDVLELAAGTYDLGTTALSITRSGTQAQPIYIRGASRQSVIFTRTSSGTFFSAGANIADVVLENFTIQGDGIDSGTAASGRIFQSSDAFSHTRITLRDTAATGIDRGVYLYNCSQCLVYDNNWTGNNLWQTTPTNFLGSNLTWNDDGINMSGTGNCAFNNTIKGFGDTFAYAKHSGDFVQDGNIATHYYRNDIRNSCDDAIEVDHARRNCTWYDNRCHNTINCDSIDPLYGGPWISARNVYINTYRSVTHKWNDQNTGQFLYNNTILNAGLTSGSGDVAGWLQANNGDQQSYGYRNNLHVYRGAGTHMVWLESPGHDTVDWTHNSWYPDRKFRMELSPSTDWANLAAAKVGVNNTTPIFSGTTRRLENDNITASNPWTDTITLGATGATEVTATYRPTLGPTDVAKNSGIAIPGITDGFGGDAPDRGAVIEGRDLVTYGDRSSGPEWLGSTAVNQWVEIAGSSMSASPPGGPAYSGTGSNPAGRMAWGTLCVDTRTSDLWGLAMGGHGDYYGNEVIRLRLTADTPKWSERYPRGEQSAAINAARTTEGKPSSAHGYLTAHFIEARNRAMRFGAAAAGPIPGTFPDVEAFDSTAATGVNGWDAAGTIPPVPGTTGTALVAGKNTLTEDVYFFRSNVAVYKWTQATNTWSTVASSLPVNFNEAAIAFDSSRGRFLIYKSNTSLTQLYTFSVSTNTFTSRSFSGDGTAISALNAANKGLGMVYVPGLDAYLIRLGGAGAAVYRVAASDLLTVSTLTTTNGGGVPAASVASGTENVNGRWAYIPNLGNGVGGIAYVPTYTANCWFLRTH